MSTLHQRLQNEFDAPNPGTADRLLGIAGGLVLTTLVADGSNTAGSNP